MKLWFRELIDVAAVSRTEDDVRSALSERTKAYGFDYYAYLHLQPQWAYAVSNYPIEWQQRYLDDDLATIDPIVKMASATLRAFDWAGKNSGQLPPKEVRHFFSEAADFGIKSGMTIPVRTAFGHLSMLTLASNMPTAGVADDIDQVEAASAMGFLHARLEQIKATPIARAQLLLTANQIRCLRWSAEGKSMKDIAVLEKMSFGTVNFHLNNARKALNAGSLAQATAIAVRLHLI